MLQWLGAGLLTGLVAATYPLVEALATPRITRHAFTPRRWTPGLRLRIAVVTDIHACDPWMSVSRIEGIVDQTLALEADLIVLVGDYVSGMRIKIDEVPAADWAPALARLGAPLGVHAVLGNHDYWDDLTVQRDPTAPPYVVTALEAAGIPTYRNTAIRLEQQGLPFWLAGLDDQLALPSSTRFGRTVTSGFDDLDATLGAITDDAPVILLAHEPDIFPRVPDRISLTLSGHTHGGQINLFGYRPFAASAGSRPYPAGYYIRDDCELVVSRGLGCTGLPIRLGNWPEILLLELGGA